MSDIKTVQALESAKAYIENSMCFHESTHRGGAIWTICDDCGQKWADDRGGFQKPKMPKAYLQVCEALALIAQMQRDAVQPVAPSVTLSADDAAFLAARLRRLFGHFNYELPGFAKADASLIRIAGSCIGAVLAQIAAPHPEAQALDSQLQQPEGHSTRASGVCASGDPKDSARHVAHALATDIIGIADELGCEADSVEILRIIRALKADPPAERRARIAHACGQVFGWDSAEQAPSEDLIRQCAEAAGLEIDLWDMGAASLVYSGGISGIPRAELVKFARLVVRRATEAGASTGAETARQGQDDHAGSPDPELAFKPDWMDFQHGYEAGLAEAAESSKAALSDEEIFDTAVGLDMPYEFLPDSYCEGLGIPPGTRAYGDVTKEQLLAFARAILARAGITRKPLTAERIFKVYTAATGRGLPNMGPSIGELLAIVRAIEAEHGITPQAGKESGDAS